MNLHLRLVYHLVGTLLLIAALVAMSELLSFNGFSREVFTMPILAAILVLFRAGWQIAATARNLR